MILIDSRRGDAAPRRTIERAGGNNLFKLKFSLMFRCRALRRSS
jgi:hypothetical protein